MNASEARKALIEEYGIPACLVGGLTGDLVFEIIAELKAGE